VLNLPNHALWDYLRPYKHIAVLSNGSYGGAMAVWNGEFLKKMPPNSGGIAGFKWRLP